VGEGTIRRERPLEHSHCYRIPCAERLYFFALRLSVLPAFWVRARLTSLVAGKRIPLSDVLARYFRDVELPRIQRKLGIEGQDDAIAAVKVLTYLHTLSGVIGQIIEMTPQRCVRLESRCPLSGVFSRHFCQCVLSYPTFTAIGTAIHPDLIHRHETYLSAGDEGCTLVFEQGAS
jgi:hypothetical protein